jgi:hypothetical protein
MSANALVGAYLGGCYLCSWVYIGKWMNIPCHGCRSPVGVPESTPQLFGNSWKTLSACSPLTPGSPLDPCDVHLQAGEVEGREHGKVGCGWDCFETVEMGTLGMKSWPDSWDW